MTRSLVVTILFLLQFQALTQEDIIFGQQLDRPYNWMKDVTSDRVHQWLIEQEVSQAEYFKKSDFKKLNSVLYAPRRLDYLETDRYKFELITPVKKPPRLVLKDLIHEEPTYETLIRCRDFKLNANDIPSIEAFRVSNNELYLIAAISHSGSDWLKLLIYNLGTRTLLDTLTGIIDPNIILDQGGFYYVRYDPPSDLNSIRTKQRLSFHEFGTTQESDRDVFVNADASAIRRFEYQRLENSKMLYVFHPLKIRDSWKEAITKIDLREFSATQPFFVYTSPHRVTFDLVMQKGDTIVMRSDLRDPNFEVLQFNTNHLNQYGSLIPPSDLVLNDVTYLSDEYLGLKYLSDGRYMGVIVDEFGQIKKKIQTYEGSSITFRRESDERAFCYHTHYLRKYNAEIIDLQNLTSHYSNRATNGYGRDFKPNIVVTSYVNKDGQDVPITIIYNKSNYSKNGDQAAMIKVYGGYGVISEPSLEWQNYLFVKNGGVLAFPGVRGSGAKGADWGFAGRGMNKQNTIDDVISASEYLIDNGFVKKDNLFLQGASQGGFIVAAAAIQRPDLFKGVIANAGVFDLITSPDESVGYAQLNREEFGDPADSLGFLNRLRLSPLHNLKKGVHYPSFLIITGSNDTRVPPSQSYRFMAMLKEKSANSLNFLHVTNGGHNISQFPQEALAIQSLKFKFLWLLTGNKYWKG